MTKDTQTTPVKTNEYLAFWKEHLFEMFLSVVLVAVAIAGISVFFGYIYASNDDVMLRNIVNGTYTGTPDGHMIYVLYPLGFVLKCLYTQFPAVEWYDVMSVGFTYLCWFLLMTAAGSVPKKKAWKAVAVGLTFIALIMLELPYVVMEHYTVLAGMLAVTAILYLMIGQDKEKKVSLFRIVVVLCMLLCLLLRKQVFLLSLPVGGIVILYRILNEKEKAGKIKELIRSGIVIALILGIGIMLFGIDKMAYSSEEWKNFEAYNEARTDAFDYYFIGDYNRFPAEYDAMEINEGLFFNIVDYNTELIPGLTTERLNKIVELGKIQRKENRSMAGQIKDALLATIKLPVKAFYDKTITPVGLALILSFIALGIWFYNQKKWKELLTEVLLFGYTALIIFVFLYKQRFPEHVSFGLYMMILTSLIGMALSMLRGAKENAKKVWLGRSALIVAGIVCLVMAVSVIRQTKANKLLKDANIADWEVVNQYCKNNPDKHYLMKTKDMVFSTEGIFTERGIEAENTYRLGSWVEESPLQMSRLSKQGGTEVYEWAKSENVFFIYREETGEHWLEEAYRNYSENGEQISIEVVDEIVTPPGIWFAVTAVRETGK